MKFSWKKKSKRFLSFLVALSMVMVTVLSSIGISYAAGDNGLTVKWIITDKWNGTGDATDYTMTPAGGALGIQATVGINSSVAYPKGEATFTIPKTLLTYRDGNTCDIVSMGVQPKNADPDFDYGPASYWYYEDDGNGNYVFTNCQEIPSNDAKAFSITYKVETSQVKGGTVASITPTNVTSGITSSGCQIKFDSKVELSTFVKSVLHDGQGERSVPASSIANNYWFGRTPNQFNFKDNMYMKYRLDASTVGNEPHTISWTDTLSAADIAKGAKIVGMSIYEDGLHCTKSIEGTTGTYILGERANDNSTPVTIEPSVGGSGLQQCYVLVEYPRNSYPALQPGDSVTFTNTGSATIEGIDTHVPSTLSDTKDAKWTKSSTGAGGGAGSDKAASAHDMVGAAAMLANNRDIDTPVFTVIHESWDTKPGVKPAPSTQDVRDCYIIDDTLTAQTSTGYQRLTEDDYYLKSLVFNKGVSEATWSDDADAYVSKTSHFGKFEIYAATSVDGAYTKIAERTYAQINAGTTTDLTIDLGTNKYVKWYVVYKGDQTAPTGQEDGRVSYSLNAQYTFVGTSPVWDTLVPNDITGFAFSNSAATPATVAATGKLVDRDANKDYTANYQGNWSPDYDPAVAGSPNAERDALLTADQTAWGSMYADGRTGKGLPRLWSGAVVTVSPVEGMSSTWKAQTNATENDKSNARAITNFQQTGSEYYTMTGETLDANIDLLHLSLSRDSAVFYDLLPAGMKYFEDDAHPTYAHGTTNEFTADVATTVVTNYKDTGRDLLIFNVSNPVNTVDPTAKNTYVPASVDGGVTRPASGGAGDNLAGTDHMQTGFRVWYSTYTPYDSMSDVSVIQSLTSYQVPDQTMLGTAFADQVDMGTNNLPSADKKRTDVWPHYTVKDADGNPVMNNLRGRDNFNPTTMGGRLMDAVYACLATPVSVDFQASSGLNKKVAPNDGDGAGIYVDETSVEINHDYTYRLQYTNSDYIQVEDMVMYDNLETANASEDHWQGTLKSINTTVAEARGIKPLIYVSTEPTTSLSLYDKSADASDFTKWNVNNPWEIYVPTAAEGEEGYFDLSTVKAVAIDLGWTNDTQTTRFTLPQLSSLSASLVFTAPESIELDDAVNTAQGKQDGKAYNYAGVSMTYKITTGGAGTATTVSDPNKFTSVQVIDSRIPIGLVKTDADGSMVGGAKFLLEQKSAMGADNYAPVTDQIVSATASNGLASPSTAEGDLVYTNEDYEPADKIAQTPLKLYPGTYRLTETEAPSGFKLDATPYDIVVAEDGTVTIKRNGEDITNKHIVNVLDISVPSIDLTKLVTNAIEDHPDYDLFSREFHFKVERMDSGNPEDIFFASESDAHDADAVKYATEMGAVITGMDYNDPEFTLENAFGNLHITKPGTYTFKITEATDSNALPPNDTAPDGRKEGYVYDNTEYTWTVKVSQTVENGLNTFKIHQELEDSIGSPKKELDNEFTDSVIDVSDTSYERFAPEFKNVYLAPSEYLQVFKEWRDGTYPDGSTYSGRPTSITIDLWQKKKGSTEVPEHPFDKVELTARNHTQSNADLWWFQWDPLYLKGTPSTSSITTATPSTPSGATEAIASDAIASQSDSEFVDEEGVLLDGNVIFDLLDVAREAYGEFVDYVTGYDEYVRPSTITTVNAEEYEYYITEEPISPSYGYDAPSYRGEHVDEYKTDIYNVGNIWYVVNKRVVTEDGNWVTLDPPVSKIVSNAPNSLNHDPADLYTFVMTAADKNSPMPEGSVDGVKTVEAHEGGIEFGEMKYTYDDLGKTFVYTLSEEKGTLENYTYDDVAYTMTVTVYRDGADGDLKITATYEPTADTHTYPENYTHPTDKVQFNNEYNKQHKGGNSSTSTIPGTSVKTPTLNSTSDQATDPTYGLNPDGTPIGNLLFNGLPKTGNTLPMSKSVIIYLYLFYMIACGGILFYINRNKKTV